MCTVLKSMQYEQQKKTPARIITKQHEDSCPDGSSGRKFAEPDPDAPAWRRRFIRRRDLLNAALGPPGGARGYGAVTSNPPSLGGSVVWWVNGMLLPEIYVERGKTYYFRVQVRYVVQCEP